MAAPKKKLVILCDGTWLDRTGALLHGIQIATGIENRSNIALLAQILNTHDKDGVPQLAFYQQGVGTTIGLVANLIAGATGDGLLENLIQAYGWLVDNFNPGDEIFLFGFSRGAYTARALSGFIAYAGILPKSKSGFLVPIITAYSRRRPSRPDLCRRSAEVYQHFTKLWPGKEAMEHEKARVKAEYPLLVGDNADEQYYWTVAPGQPRVEPPPIKAIAVFDTVGSLGIPGLFDLAILRDRFDFFDTALSSNVQFAYQALALQENRADFRPTLWQTRAGGRQVVVQTWFKGSHPDVGGGYYEHGLSDITLAWIVAQLTDHPEGELLSFRLELLKRTQDRTRVWGTQPPHPTRLPFMFRRERQVLAAVAPAEQAQPEEETSSAAAGLKALVNGVSRRGFFEHASETLHHSVTIGDLVNPDTSDEFRTLRERNPAQLSALWAQASDAASLLPTERALRWTETQPKLQPLSITYGRMYGLVNPARATQLQAALMLLGALFTIGSVLLSYVLQVPVRAVAFVSTLSWSTENLMFVPPPGARAEVLRAWQVAQMAWGSLLSPGVRAVEYGLQPIALSDA